METKNDGLRRPGPPIFNEQEKTNIKNKVANFIRDKATPEQKQMLIDILEVASWNNFYAAWQKILNWQTHRRSLKTK